MNKVHSFLRRFARDESGAALAEYAAIFLILAVAGTVILVTVGETLRLTGVEINDWLDTNVLGAFELANGGGG
jgi:Flp pilus assembly pilin Flp